MTMRPIRPAPSLQSPHLSDRVSCSPNLRVQSATLRLSRQDQTHPLMPTLTTIVDGEKVGEMGSARHHGAAYIQSSERDPGHSSAEARRAAFGDGDAL